MDRVKKFYDEIGVGKVVATVVGGMLIAGSNASAALSAPDMSGAETDVTTVVVAIVGFVVIIFGFKKVIGLISGR